MTRAFLTHILAAILAATTILAIAGAVMVVGLARVAR